MPPSAPPARCRDSGARLVLARRLSHSGSVPLTWHYGRHPRDTPGRSGPRNPQRTKHTPMSSDSSQADSAGSIPVTRSTLEKRCRTNKSGTVSHQKRRPRNHPGAASPCPLTRPLYISAESCGGPQLGGIGELVGGAPVVEPVVELGGGHGSGHVVALCLVAAEAFQLRVGEVGLDAFGDHA